MQQEEYKFRPKFRITDRVVNICNYCEGVVVDIHYAALDNIIKYLVNFPSEGDSNGFTRELYSEVEIALIEKKKQIGLIKKD